MGVSPSIKAVRRELEPARAEARSREVLMRGVNPMVEKATAAEVQRTIESQTEKLRRLEHQKEVAMPVSEQNDIQRQIDIVAKDIHNLGIVLEGLAKR